MKAQIKVLHTKEGKTKSGKSYTKVLVLITLGESEFVETYYLYK